MIFSNILGCVWLLWWTTRPPRANEQQLGGGAQTGHVWDHDLREYNNPLPRWWLWVFYLTVVFGLVAATRIGISQMPDVDFPTINVSVIWEGAAPEVVENDVFQPLEKALIQVEGVRSLTYTSRLGSGNVTGELDIARNVDLAMQDVSTRIQQAMRRLPRDIDPPVVSKTNPEDNPIL